MAVDAKSIIRNVKRLLPAYWPNSQKYHSRSVRPQVVYLIAMPRTGSTLAKRYLGEHCELVVAPNRTYRHAWKMARQLCNSQIVIDKRINNIDKLNHIYFDYGNQVWFTGIIRDPRDELTSLLETDRHAEVPRNANFWSYWKSKYETLLKFAEIHAPQGGQFSLVRYEDLVMQPEQVKSDFLNWIGIRADRNDLDRSYSNVDPEIARGNNVTEDWKVHQNNAVHQQSFGRWKDVTDPANAQLISHYLQLPKVCHLMERFGYGTTVTAAADDFPGIRLLGSQSEIVEKNKAA